MERMILNAERVKQLERALTPATLERLRDLAAFGPSYIRPEVDEPLYKAGWITSYGPKAVDLVSGAVGTLFADNGSVRQIWQVAADQN